MINEPVNKEEERKASRKSGFRKRSNFLKLMSKDKSAIIGMVIVVAFLGWSAIQGFLEYMSSFPKYANWGYMLLPSSPYHTVLADRLLPPSTKSVAFWFGTNLEGESILSRMLYAMPRDAFVSVIVVFSAIVIGAILGISAAYRGGWLETIIMRLTDSFLAIPALILVIAISIPLRATYFGVILGLSIVWWPTYTRFFRGQVLRLKNMDFVEAAKINNVKTHNFFIKYLFLNSVDPIIAYAALDFGNVILTYSTLAFLGIGLSIPIPELGAMASNGLGYLPADWWYSFFPGIAILIIVIGFVLVGDRYQDLINNRIDY